MGSPKIPTPSQVGQLRAAAAIAPPRTIRLNAQKAVELVLPPEGVALIEA
jgi:hypothetical protein